MEWVTLGGDLGDLERFGGSPGGICSAWGGKNPKRVGSGLFLAARRPEAERPPRPRGHRPWLKVAAIRDVRARVTAGRRGAPKTAAGKKKNPTAPQRAFPAPDIALPAGIHPQKIAPRLGIFFSDFGGYFAAAASRPTLSIPRAPGEIAALLPERWSLLQADFWFAHPTFLTRFGKAKKLIFFTQNSPILLI